MLGPPQRLTFSFQETAGLDAQRLRLLFVREVAREGVLTTGTLLPSFAHDERAVERTTEAMTAALERVAAATRSAQAALAAAVSAGFGASGSNGAAGPAGSIDAIRDLPGRLEVSGWLLLADGPPDSVEFVASGGEVRLARQIPRPDLASAYPKAGDAARGFEVTLPATVFATEDAYDFTIRGRRRNSTAFHCRIVRSRKAPPGPTGAPRLEADGVLYA